MLVVDGHDVFEIDEECIKRRKIPNACKMEEYLDNKKAGKRHNSNLKKDENTLSQQKK